MFEIPECLTIAEQMNDTVRGKVIESGNLGNSPHKFVWYNREQDEFDRLSKGKTVGKTIVRGRWIFTPIEPGFVLVLGECGGKILFHSPDDKTPKKYHLQLIFDDDSFLTVTTQMWGGMELFDEGDELEREYVKDMRTTPAEPEFTSEYFDSLVSSLVPKKKRSVKSLLTQEQLIPGLGNAIAQDIMFRARLHPRHPISELDDVQRRELFMATTNTVKEITEKGGRYDEFDLYGRKGGYVRVMDKNAAGNPCLNCGTMVEKIQYLGGACYLCPTCQV